MGRTGRGEQGSDPRRSRPSMQGETDVQFPPSLDARFATPHRDEAASGRDSKYHTQGTFSFVRRDDAASGQGSGQGPYNRSHASATPGGPGDSVGPPERSHLHTHGSRNKRKAQGQTLPQDAQFESEDDDESRLAGGRIAERHAY